jgi:16S rRNA (guanine966-N2)-methyltransferase
MLRRGAMKRAPGRLRIIGGEWRSRRVDFDAAEGVRPTPDRVRQTVFDWLAPLIEGARCLDLFAGSGALGLEALSRGAAHVAFVDNGRAQARAIVQALDTLQARTRAAVVQADALGFLASPQASRYDIVFLDPPYDAGLHLPVLAALRAHLTPTNRVYVEWRKGAAPAFPDGYAVLREKAAGQVSYGLLRYGAGPGEIPT